ncbi:MAG: nitroreductase family protein [Bacteroidota bacterium]|nr:nitroreductase family protein [Bacteroidota bacterium]
MDFKELVEKRQSVRKYSSKAIEKEKLEQILESARLSPSACNSQPWHFVVIDNPEIKNSVAKATFNKVVNFNKFVTQAAVIIVIVIEKPTVISEIGGRIKNKEYPLFDIGIVAEHICLQAEELNIGSCMIGWFDEKKIMKTLNIPNKKTVGLVITLGYAPEGYKLRKKIRKNKNEIISFNKYK